MSSIRFRDTTGGSIDFRLSNAVKAAIENSPVNARRLGELLASHVQQATLLDQAGALLDRAHSSLVRLTSRPLIIYTRFVGDKTLGRARFSDETS